MWFKRLSILATIVTVAGCQSLPQPSEKKIPEKPTQADKEQKTPSGVTIHPYDREEIQRQKIVIPEQKSHAAKFPTIRSPLGQQSSACHYTNSLY